MSDTPTTKSADDLYKEFQREQKAFDRHFKSFEDSTLDIVRQLECTANRERDYKMHLAEVVAEQQISLINLRAKVSRLQEELALARSERDQLKVTVARKRARRTEDGQTQGGSAGQTFVVPTAWPVETEVARQRDPESYVGAASQSQDNVGPSG